MISYNDVDILDLVLVKINEHYYFGEVSRKFDNKLILKNVIFGNENTHKLGSLILYKFDIENLSSVVNVKRCLKSHNANYYQALNNMESANIQMMFPELFI